MSARSWRPISAGPAPASASRSARRSTSTTPGRQARHQAAQGDPQEDLRRRRDHQVAGREGPGRARQQPAPRRADRDAGVRRRQGGRHRAHARSRRPRPFRPGDAARRPHRRAVRSQGDGGLHLHAQAPSPRGRQDPRPLDRPLLPRHPAAAGRQGAVRRPAFRRNGGVGARSLRRRLHAAGDADGEVGRRRRPHQGLRGDRARRRHVRGRHPGIVQRAGQGDAFARPQRRPAQFEAGTRRGRPRRPSNDPMHGFGAAQTRRSASHVPTTRRGPRCVRLP